MSDTQLFENFKQGVHMATVNYYSEQAAVVKAGAKSPLPPKDNVRLDSYKDTWEKMPILCWGKDNKYPYHLDAEAKKSTVLQGGLKVLSDHMRGQSLSLARPVFKNGQRILEEVEDNEVMDELYEIGYYEYWHDACHELPMWGNMWPIFFMNDKRDISLIKVNDGTYNRLQRAAPKTGRIENFYVSAQWGTGIHHDITASVIPDALKPYINEYPLLDRYNYTNELSYTTTKKSFGAHVKYNTSGAIYGRAPWHSLYENRFLAISGQVPQMLIRYYEAMMTIRYLFYINEQWSKDSLFKNTNGSEEEKKKKLKELQQSYEDNLKGTGNALKSLMLSFKMINGKEEKSVMIETLDNKLSEGDHIPSSQLADGQTLFALGVDPSLLGVVVPGGKQSAGSGSNIREASLALQMRLRPDRELAHLPFYIWRDYKFRDTKDKQKKQLVIICKDYIINTLDQRAPAAAQETTPTN